jgi:hypothetical protein
MAVSLKQPKEAVNVHHHQGRHRCDVRLCRFSCRRRSIRGIAWLLSSDAKLEFAESLRTGATAIPHYSRPHRVELEYFFGRPDYSDTPSRHTGQGPMIE